MKDFSLKVFCIVYLMGGLVWDLPAQGGWSFELEMGAKYLVPAESAAEPNLWANMRPGIPLSLAAEYQWGRWFGGVELAGGPMLLRAGVGPPLWAGRNRPLQASVGWWEGRATLRVGRRFSIPQLPDLQWSPFVAGGIDHHALFPYCGVGASISPDLQLPIAQAEWTPQNSSSRLWGAGFFTDYRLRKDPVGIWLRFGVSGWWREASLLTGSYRLWKHGGASAQMPPWGDPPPRPGQLLLRYPCPSTPLVQAPDQAISLDFPGHQLRWTVGLRFDLPRSDLVQ